MLRRPVVAVGLAALLLFGPPATAATVPGSPAPAATAPPAGTVPSASTTQPAATPLLSARRDPTWIEDTLAAQRLAQAVGPLTSGVTDGCVDVEQAGAPVYQLDPTKEVEPASNMKLLTATAALDILGAGYRYTTTVVASAAPVGGTLNGNLYLVGGGDPYLFTAAYDHSLYYSESVYTSVDQLAAQVRAAGITTVNGSVVGVATRYDGQIGVATWSPSYLAESDVGPLSALELDDGGPPPPTAGQPADTGPADPPLFAAQAFTAVLKAAGVQVDGPATAGAQPARTVAVTRIQSAPLADELEQMLRTSDDTAAELVAKEIGYRAAGQGSTAAGTAAVERDVAADGLPAGQLVALDGSGLDTGDRVTCSLIVDTLERAGTSGVIATGLPVAARSGTLTNRLAGTAAAGRVHAKTGTLDQVSALSGYVVPLSAPTAELAEPVWFSIIINGMDSVQAAPLVDRITAAIAGYPRVPALASVEPEP